MNIIKLPTTFVFAGQAVIGIRALKKKCNFWCLLIETEFVWYVRVDILHGIVRFLLGTTITTTCVLRARTIRSAQKWRLTVKLWLLVFFSPFIYDVVVVLYAYLSERHARFFRFVLFNGIENISPLKMSEGGTIDVGAHASNIMKRISAYFKRFSFGRS